MKAEFIICANSETICSGYTDENLDCWRDEIAGAFFDAAAKVILDAGHDYRLSTTFADWNGGKYSSHQCGRMIAGRTWGYTSGLVATLAEAPPAWMVDLIDAAAQAGADARDAAIDEYAAMEAAADEADAAE